MAAYRDCSLQLRIGREVVRIRMRIPDAPLSIPEFLPVAQALTDLVASSASREAETAGRGISCGPGCGACCRQLVPVGEAEALHLYDLCRKLDAVSRARVVERFEEMQRRLRAAGLLDALNAVHRLKSQEARRELGLAYFRLQIPCPFLDDKDSCSIHRDRPLACREYLVTSSPRHCAQIGTADAEILKLPVRVSALFYRFGDGIGEEAARWLPLPLTLEWAASETVQSEHRTYPGPALFERFVRLLAGEKGGQATSPGIHQP
ncbi:MAG: YkgJ family cysteine cluster protein [Pseudomonadota bacterium]|nr:YkgJ family cysteine cluster protein [Pseudomonadota bacterium]